MNSFFIDLKGHSQEEANRMFYEYLPTALWGRVFIKGDVVNGKNGVALLPLTPEDTQNLLDAIARMEANL